VAIVFPLSHTPVRPDPGPSVKSGTESYFQSPPTPAFPGAAACPQGGWPNDGGGGGGVLKDRSPSPGDDREEGAAADGGDGMGDAAYDMGSGAYHSSMAHMPPGNHLIRLATPILNLRNLLSLDSHLFYDLHFDAGQRGEFSKQVARVNLAPVSFLPF